MPAIFKMKIYNGMSRRVLSVEFRPHHIND
jgi:hypothetical protein